MSRQSFKVCSRDGTVRVWNASNLNPEGILHSCDNYITDMQYVSRSNELIVSCVDRTYVQQYIITLKNNVLQLRNR